MSNRCREQYAPKSRKVTSNDRRWAGGSTSCYCCYGGLGHVCCWVGEEATEEGAAYMPPLCHESERFEETLDPVRSSHSSATYVKLASPKV